jgi:molecular chaperone Hsp33
MCHCGEQQIRTMLSMLALEELADMAENGPFPVELRCHHCSTCYYFDQEEVRRIYGMRYSDN